MAIFAVSVVMTKVDPGNVGIAHTLCTGSFVSEDEARGHACAKALAKNPQFGIVDVLINEIELTEVESSKTGEPT